MHVFVLESRSVKILEPEKHSMGSPCLRNRFFTLQESIGPVLDLLEDVNTKQHEMKIVLAELDASTSEAQDKLEYADDRLDTEISDLKKRLVTGLTRLDDEARQRSQVDAQAQLDAGSRVTALEGRLATLHHEMQVWFRQMQVWF